MKEHITNEEKAAREYLDFQRQLRMPSLSSFAGFQCRAIWPRWERKRRQRSSKHAGALVAAYVIRVFCFAVESIPLLFKVACFSHKATELF